MIPYLRSGVCIVALIFVCLTTAAVADPTTTDPKHRPIPGGVYIDLTEEFYRALNEDAREGHTTLSTDMSEDYLHRIAVATQYMVKTNLEILKQQERIVHLLESMQTKPPVKSP